MHNDNVCRCLPVLPCSICDPNVLEQEESFTLRGTDNRLPPLFFFQRAEFISGDVIDSFCFLPSGSRGNDSSLPDRVKGVEVQLHSFGFFFFLGKLDSQPSGKIEKAK